MIPSVYCYREDEGTRGITLLCVLVSCYRTIQLHHTKIVVAAQKVTEGEGANKITVHEFHVYYFINLPSG